jgi:hypothetical protein
MKKSTKYILTIFSAVVVIAIVAVTYTFNAPRNDVSSENVDYKITAEQLIACFASDDEAADIEFKDKIIMVTGIIAEINDNEASGTNCILSSDEMSTIICEFEPGKDEIIRKYSAGDTIKIKGKYSGFLMDVVLNTCSVGE